MELRLFGRAPPISWSRRDPAPHKGQRKKINNNNTITDIETNTDYASKQGSRTLTPTRTTAAGHPTRCAGGCCSRPATAELLHQVLLSGGDRGQQAAPSRHLPVRQFHGAELTVSYRHRSVEWLQWKKPPSPPHPALFFAYILCSLSRFPFTTQCRPNHRQLPRNGGGRSTRSSRLTACGCGC